MCPRRSMEIFDFYKKDIEKMEMERDINGLKELLRQKKNQIIRRNAVSALGRIGDKSAVVALSLIHI